MSYFIIDGKVLSVSILHRLVKSKVSIQFSEDIIAKIDRNRNYLESKIKDSGIVIYGINTGFGSLCNVQISDQNLEKLQENLVLSHACGMGDLVPVDICKAILLLKIINLSHGYSGVRMDLIHKLAELYNADITPVLYQLGSLGASGDLAPLAHLSLPLIAEGKVYCNGNILASRAALKENNISPIKLKAKEGLALLNGTQFSSAYATIIASEAFQLLGIANKISALSMDAYMCDIAPFDPLIHDIRPHEGQKLVAKSIYQYLTGSDVRNIQKQSVQDPYSF
ncbi:MAG: aromatic amino acid ammonia-lyase, partial [Saprospiraceae bacterium]